MEQMVTSNFFNASADFDADTKKVSKNCSNGY